MADGKVNVNAGEVHMADFDPAAERYATYAIAAGDAVNKRHDDMGKQYNKSKNPSLMPIITHVLRLTGRLQENQSVTSVSGIATFR